VSLALQGVRLASLKFGSQADVATSWPTGKPKVWLTITHAHICGHSILQQQMILSLHICCMNAWI